MDTLANLLVGKCTHDHVQPIVYRSDKAKILELETNWRNAETHLKVVNID